ncbi:MAG: glycosyltransferase [Verrucomicrobiales bacterium]
MKKAAPPSDPAAPGESATTKAPLVEVYGFLNSAIGLGGTARTLVQALRTVGCPVRPIAVPLKGRARVDFTTEELPSSQPSPEAAVRILHLNPEHIPQLLPNLPADFFVNARTVILPYWETEDIPDSAKACAPYFDEVWCTTRFLAQSFGKGLGLPVRVFPAPLPFPENEGADVGSRFDFEGRYLFLFSFDYYSCFKRKNPDGLCEAFTRAFPTQEPGGPILVVKSSHAQEHLRQAMYLKARFTSRADIILIDEYLSESDRNALVSRCDAYVSLHRSEGLGMTILEAMAQGKPCIATAYSGNLDFTLPEHSYPIPFHKSAIGPGSIHYPEDEEWAEPDLDAAASAMRECHANQEAARSLGKKSLAWVREHHQFKTVGTVVLGLIRELVARPIDKVAKQAVLDELAVSRPFEPPSHNGAAYLSIRQAREYLKEVEALLDTLPKRHKSIADACRRLAQTNKLLASAISNSLKQNKEMAARAEREMEIKEHYENLLLKVMIDNMGK